MAQFSVTVDNTKVPASATDFPALVDLSDMPAAFWSTVTASGGDIRVYEDDGTTELAREVVSCDTTAKTGELWVKVTNLSSIADTEIIIDVDGVRSDYAVTATYGRNAVWSDYAFVFHGTSLVDSTGNAGALINSSATQRASGIIGEDYEYNLSHIYASAVPATVNATDTFTMSVWFEPTDPSSLPLDSYIFGVAESSGAFDNFSIYLNRSGSRLDFGVFDRNTSALAEIAFSVDPYAGKALIEAEVTSTGSTLRANNAGTKYSGASTRHLQGAGFDRISIGALLDSSPETTERSYLDEARIYEGAYPAGWADTEYNNQSSPSTFYAVTEVAGGTTIDAVGVQIALTSHPAQVLTGTSLQAALAAIDLTPHPAGISLGTSVAAAPQQIEHTPHPATVDLGTAIAANVTAISLTANPADVSLGEAISAALQSITVTTHPAQVSTGAVISAAVQQIVLAPHAATTETGAGITGQSHQIALESFKAGIELGITIKGSLHQISVAALAATVGLGDQVDAFAQAIELTTHGASITLGTDLQANTAQIALASFSATVSAGVAPLTVPGLEFTLPADRMHFALPISRIHFTFTDEDR